jgi:hypothetical protein
MANKVECKIGAKDETGKAIGGVMNKLGAFWEKSLHYTFAFNEALKSANTLIRTFSAPLNLAAQFSSQLNTSITSNITNFAKAGTFELSTETAQRNFLQLQNGVKELAIQTGGCEYP